MALVCRPEKTVAEWKGLKVILRSENQTQEMTEFYKLCNEYVERFKNADRKESNSK